jgi:hypothetical protein
MSEEVRSKSLQRYYDNKEIYNEKAKQYFRSVWYVKNREMVLKKQKEYRDSRRPQTNRKRVEPIIPTINRSLIVSFD